MLSTIGAAANSALLKHDEPHMLQYLIREPCDRAVNAHGSIHTFAVGPHTSRGLGTRLQVRPSGWQMIASLDLLLPTAHFLLPTSYFLLPTSYFLLPTLQVRPSGWQMIASLDGLPSIPLPARCIVSMTIEPDRNFWLRTTAPEESD